MSDLRFNHKVTVTATMELSEAELNALDALAGYGIDGFLKVFYSEMGEAYLKPHEAGLRKLFGRIQSQVGFAISDVEKARKALS